MPRIEALRPCDEEWLQTQLAAARRFVDAHAPEFAGEDLSPAALEEAWAAWLESGPEEAAARATIDAVAAAFGQSLVSRTPLRWVLATDGQGSAMAVHGLPGRGDVLVYPIDLVAREYRRRSKPFVVRSYLQITRYVAAIGAPTSPFPRRP